MSDRNMRREAGEKPKSEQIRMESERSEGNGTRMYKKPQRKEKERRVMEDGSG